MFAHHHPTVLGEKRPQEVVREHVQARRPGRSRPSWSFCVTFKGLTDATLAWQTEQFLELETHREGITVFVRPETSDLAGLAPPSAMTPPCAPVPLDTVIDDGNFTVS